MLEEDFRSVRYSQTTLTELMIPSYANFGGKIHGGILLSLMDKVAYACASKHAGAYCVTVSVDSVDFVHPVEVGDLISLKASVNYVGRTSLVVGIKVIAENVTNGTVRHTNTSYFTMVAKDRNDKPKQVPGLILESRDDIRRFLEAIRRRQLKNEYNEELSLAKNSMEIDAEIDKLKSERCTIRICN